MRLLLDTCTFIWLMTSPNRVPPTVQQRFRDPENTAYFSVASAWEISIKSKLGQLELPEDPASYIPDRLAAYGLTVLDVQIHHAIRAGVLSLHHKDPFDRMLIAQAEIEQLTVATPDPAFRPYGVKLLW